MTPAETTGHPPCLGTVSQRCYATTVPSSQPWAKQADMENDVSPQTNSQLQQRRPQSPGERVHYNTSR
eukprot:CAMPEP_0119324240 /NCGR_PEP_ID=MMETSP1333-20130426/62660_1 /TAXON_ID=418940 /ORGANISM="Scyphosphaera apsteinii, Strain RCC1455" /LENGTH=67 /DNA_ID=CAMNT_0007331897 /DNA_START=853 /DNA_END=1053 /DNA_ORIENTATION=-